MKLFFALVSFCLASGLWAADGATAVVSSVEELRSKGVTFRRQQLQTPGASVEIESLVASGRAVGQYEFTECIVLKEGVLVDHLAELDAAPANAEAFARRSKSTHVRSVFLIRGKEIANAYIAFEFSSQTSSGAGATHRYLLPVSAIKRTKVVTPEEPEPNVGP